MIYTILNQKVEDVVCQKASSVVAVCSTIEEKSASSYNIIIAANADV